MLRRSLPGQARRPREQDPGYSDATGLEPLGYLYLTGQEARILELFDIAVPMP